MAKRSQDFDEEYSQSKRLRTIDGYEMFYAYRRSGEHVQNCDELYRNSTPAFRGTHLIDNYRVQQQLIDICFYELGRGPYVHVQYGSNLFHHVSDAIGDFAYERLISILNYGCFDSELSNCRRNTIIVSMNLLLHIERSSHPYYDICFILEQISCLTAHLDKNEYGSIHHFGACHRTTC